MQERTQKIALAARAASADDPRAETLLRKAAQARKILQAQGQASAGTGQPPTRAVVDLEDPAPSAVEMVQAATVSASEGIESTPGSVPAPPEPDAASDAATQTSPLKTPAKGR